MVFDRFRLRQIRQFPSDRTTKRSNPPEAETAERS
jgi:hypothetical protein